jgi:predicted nucleotidyltransferase
LAAGAPTARFNRRAASDWSRAYGTSVASFAPKGAIDAAWLVGSLAWGGFGARSDVDLVVRGAALETLGAIAARAEEKLGPDAQGRIDVLRLEDLPPSFRERVLSTGWRLDES